AKGVPVHAAGDDGRAAAGGQQATEGDEEVAEHAVAQDAPAPEDVGGVDRPAYESQRAVDVEQDGEGDDQAVAGQEVAELGRRRPRREAESTAPPRRAGVPWMLSRMGRVMTRPLRVRRWRYWAASGTAGSKAAPFTPARRSSSKASGLMSTSAAVRVGARPRR